MSKLVISTSVFQSQVADLLPCNNHQKSQLIHSLLNAYKLLPYFDEVLVFPYVKKTELVEFHSKAYTKLLINEKLNKMLPQDIDDPVVESKWNELIELAKNWNEKVDDHSTQEVQRFASREDLYEYYHSQLHTLEEDNDIGSSDVMGAYDETSTTDPCLSDDEKKEYNLEGDCPIFSYLPMHCQVITGATLNLLDHMSPTDRLIGINWDGGRHHAFKQKANGFCYVNDVVLLIQRLRKMKINKITYVDFDLHHGDGVEKAFQYSKQIQTISVHLYEPGFFPGTGSLLDSRKGKNVVNIPLKHGCDDSYLDLVASKIIGPLIKRHVPEVLIIECGGDGLLGDRFNEWQLTIRGLSQTIVNIMKSYPQAHIFLLGGGGYNNLLMSRFYTYLTWCVVKEFSNARQVNDLNQSDPFNICDGDDDSEQFILEHDLVEMYGEENYQYWIYEMEGSSWMKTLRNDNKVEDIVEIMKHYEL
ncbi:hos1p [Saccharomyces arboricola H-6]|uniref:histone deacetylase n=1 Tax=Saccharomyces arboricola (strain H-6 / AS 2.3317 / CBS 10644) TaxID=1160507 RepID=J8LH27_SACAR|nr:hos1p [Saccharomyces arboricola H-6]